VDASGTRVPDANVRIRFQIKGPAAIAAVDSADDADPEPFQADSRRAYRGRCFAIVRAEARSGKVSLTATADGLPSARINLSISDSLPRKPYEPAAPP
jgi:beta-galactosidase